MTASSFDSSDLLPQPSGPRPTEQELLATVFRAPRSLSQRMADAGSIRNVQPRDQPFLSIQTLRWRGWSRGMVKDLLGVEDRRDPVDHWFNFSGKKMYALDRVERAESLMIFETRFLEACKRSREFREMKDDVLEDCRELREARRAEEPPLEASAHDRMAAELAEVFAIGRRLGYRTPHKC
jgi:hypothetical protein